MTEDGLLVRAKGLHKVFHRGSERIDVLQGLDPLKICVGYQVDGREVTEYPADIDVLRRCTPVYREVPGFQEDLSGVRAREDLPAGAAAYVKALEDAIEAPVGLLSVGPERTETVRLEVA